MGIEQHVSSHQATPVSPEHTISRFCYRIGQHTLLLEAEIMAEVLMSQTIYPLPFAPTWCMGLVSLRGDLFPVIDMHKVVQGKSAHSNPQLLLIHHPQFSPVILTCDGFPRQIKLTPDDLKEHPAENLPSWIPHILHHNGQVLLAANHGRLLRRIRQVSAT